MNGFCSGSKQPVSLVQCGDRIVDRQCPKCGRSFKWHELQDRLRVVPNHSPVDDGSIATIHSAQAFVLAFVEEKFR